MPTKGEYAMSKVLEFATVVVNNLPELPQDILQYWIENPVSVQRVLRTAFCPSENNSKSKRSALVLNWSKLYDLLGMSARYNSEITRLAISDQEGLWTIPVIKGVSCNKVVAGYKKAFVDVYAYIKDLDNNVIINDRDPNRDGSYFVSFNGLPEADEENKNQSANQRKAKGRKDITLLERLLLGLAYFLATSQNLDAKNITQCQGSLYLVDNVPFVCWRPVFRRVYVGWHLSDFSHDRFRARSVVSRQL
jgi:hypothetical protein